MGGGATGKSQERAMAATLYTHEARAPGLLGIRAHGCDGRRDVASIQGTKVGGMVQRLLEVG